MFTHDNMKSNIDTYSIGLVIYKILLDLVYVLYICNVYGYYKDFKLSITTFCLVESWVLYIALIYFTPKKEKRISASFLLLQLTIFIAPMLTIYGLNTKSRYFTYLICLLHIIQCIIYKHVKMKDKSNRVNMIIGRNIIRGVLVVFSIITVLLTFLQFGLNGLQAFNFSKVYEIRAVNKAAFPLSYMSHSFFLAVLPVLLLDYLERKKVFHILFLLVAALYVYSVFAMKGWLFVPFVVILVYFIMKKNLFSFSLCWGMPILICVTAITYKIGGKFLMISSMLYQRILFLPASIKYNYYAFFSQHEKLYFAEGQIGRLLNITSPYSKEAAFVIGDEMGLYGSHANTGYFADAYAQIGTLGVILFMLIIIFLFITIDAYVGKDNYGFCFSAMALSLYVLNDGALLTTMLTGGMAFLIIILYFWFGKRTDTIIN